jgi:hypothetical protein
MKHLSPLPGRRAGNLTFPAPLRLPILSRGDSRRGNDHTQRESGPSL